MEFNINNITSLIGIFVSVFLVVFLFSSKKKVSNYFLAAYLICLAIDIGAGFMTIYVHPYFPKLGIFLSLSIYFVPPLLYFFIKSTVYKDFKLSYRTFLHTLPFILVNIILIPHFYLWDFDDGNVWEITDSFFFVYLIPSIYISLHILSFLYLLLSFFILFAFDFHIRKN